MGIKWLTYIILSIATVLFVSIPKGYSQKTTRIRGVVTDSKTKEPLPFVNVILVGKSIGTITDYDGSYEIETQWASNKLKVSFVGYHSQTKTIEIGKSQYVNFQMEPEDVSLGEVLIKSKKKRYRNKNNPAVELIKKVIANKDKNRKEQLSFYEYDKYEKVEFDLNNITEKFRNKKAFKKFQFIFNYVDTSEINGKPYLPVFLKETLSKMYYRKSPKAEKEYVTGTNMIGFHDYIDNEGVSYIIDYMYQDINIYENNITILTNEFTSPLSTISPLIYKFRIIDTLDVNGHDCINLAFQPRNKLDFAFKGNLYVTNDGRFAVIKLDMRVTEDINLNFVKDLKFVQEFDYKNSKAWMLTRDEITVDFNFGKKGTGMYGKKTVYYDNYLFDQQRSDTIYEGIETKMREEGYMERDEDFWAENRLSELSEQEQNIYTMVDSVQNVPAFKRTMDVIMLFVAGYWNFGPFDLGAVNTFYSFNDVEGFRLRLGGRTSDKFSELFRMEGYLLYGTLDNEFKYSGSATWSLNGKPLKDNPRHSIMAMYQKETNFPGMDLQFINEDNFLLSFKRGVADKLLFYELYNIEHYRDWKNGFSTTVDLKHIVERPGGTLRFDYEDYSIDKITTSEIITRLRFAPNEKFYQGMNYRTPIITKYPIFQLTYTQGIKDLFNSDYNYGKLTFNFFKRIHLAPLGFTNFEVEAGKVFSGGIPFPLLYVHRANQTYSYQLRSYNLMNFLEFISDQYVAVYAEHHFYGFFFNKIPLFKRLKWREIITFKGIYGGVSDENNPEKTSGLMLFPTDVNGNPTTFILKTKPYMEASVGIGNIFKFFRVDLVKRLTYLDNPNVSDLGIRARFKLDF